MTTKTLPKPARAVRAPSPVYLDDDSEAGIRTYLASVRPIRDVADLESGEGYQRGRALIERMALDCRGREYERPTMRLTAAECASVIEFLGNVEPIETRTWWAGHHHVVGFYLVLETLQRSLEAAPMEVRQ